MQKINISTKKYPNTFALVDNDNYDELNKWKWYRSENGYAVRTVRTNEKRIYMHKEVNKTPIGFLTDHINRNKLDNRKKNLRTATKGLNNINRDLTKNNTSGYKGVYWHKSNKKWVAYISNKNKRIHLGHFYNIQGAWLARRWGERLHYGAFLAQ